MPRRRYSSEWVPSDALFECFLCQRPKQCGGGIWEAHYVPSWHLLLCNSCRSANHDGIVPTSTHGQRLVEHLRARDITIELNSRGWIPIPLT